MGVVSKKAVGASQGQSINIKKKGLRLEEGGLLLKLVGYCTRTWVVASSCFIVPNRYCFFGSSNSEHCGKSLLL